MRIIGKKENPWGVDVIDCREMAKTISTSQNEECAKNAASFGQEDGLCFVGMPAVKGRSFPLELSFPTEGHLADGVLFNPRVMEEKWALYLHGSRIYVVRSWTREVWLTADVQKHNDHLLVTNLSGRVWSEDEPPVFTVMAFDYLVRSHAMGETLPAPLHPDAKMTTQGLEKAALMSFSIYGRLALFPTTKPLSRYEFSAPLRTNTLLHIALARGDFE